MKYAVDAGIIKCICGFDEDDGFTIQCESCNVWQHAVCVGIGSEAEVPDVYLCDQCGPRELDVKAAHEKQKTRLENIKQLQEKKRRKESEEKEGLSNGDASATTQTTQTPPIPASRESTEQPDNKEENDYHFDYTVIPRNTVDPAIQEYLNKLANEEIADKDISYMSLSEYSKIVKPKMTLKLFQDNPKSKFCGFSKHGLVANQPIQKDRFIIEYVGHVSHKNQYKEDPINQYRIHPVPKSSVLFHPTLPLVVDGRLVGNDARFMRRSCSPNCRVATVVVNNTDIIFVVFATEPIKPGTELTLAWEWDSHHPVQKMLHGSEIDQLTPQEKQCLGNMVETILQRTECSDPTNSQCILQKMKKCVSANPRSVRGSKTRALNLLKETNGEGGSSYEDSGKSSSASPNPELMPSHDLSIGFGIGSSYKGYGGYGGLQFPSPVPPTCMDYLDKLDDEHHTIALDYIEAFAYVDPPYYERVEEPVSVPRTPKSPFLSPSLKRREPPVRDDQASQETQTVPIDKRLRADESVKLELQDTEEGAAPAERPIPFKTNLYRMYQVRSAQQPAPPSPVVTTPFKRLSMKEYFDHPSGTPSKEINAKVEDKGSESPVEDRRNSGAKKGKLSFADYMKQKKRGA